MIATLMKQPGEILRPAVAFTGGTGSGSITAIRDVTVIARGLVPGATALAASAMLANGIVTLALSGGSDGERYAVTVRADDAHGQTLESEVEVVMIESTWATPDGGAGWLSIAALVKRFTLDEVVRMTDPDGSGRIDRDLLIGALIDAQSIVEAHIASRYALPLATVPRILEMAVGDLARARLYPRGVPEGIADQAKAAMALLVRIQKGDATLGLPAAVTPAETDSDAPVVIAPGQRAYPDWLRNY
ncbi:phage protein Gp36 family protein [Sphingomonas zeae]